MIKAQACLRLSHGATKEELRQAHKHKMMGKFFRNREFGSYLPFYGPEGIGSVPVKVKRAKRAVKKEAK